MKKKAIFFIIPVIILFLNCREKRTVFSGIIEAKQVDVSSQVNGRVKKIFVEEGEKVKKNEELAKIDDRLLISKKNAIEAIYFSAKKNYERAERLFKKHAISQSKYEKIKYTFFKVKSEYESAKIMLEETLIRSPWDGIVLEKLVEEGESITLNTPLFTIGKLDEVDVIIYVPLYYLGKIHIGDNVFVKIDSFNNKKYKGKITYISDKAEFTPKNIQTKDERVKEVFKVKAKLKNENYELKPGMPCDVYIEL